MRSIAAGAYGASHTVVAPAALGLVGCCVLYNAGLAALNALGLHQTYGTVAAAEILILAATGAYVVTSGIPVADPSRILLVVFGIATALFITLASQVPAVDCARATAIIGLFTVLGRATTERQIFTLFRVLSLAVLAGLVVEIADTPLFVKIFQPADYYAATRGIETFELDDSGLFRNSLGFEGRFSFGLSSHRTASVFIEQVSLANFSGVLIVFLLACFDRLKRGDLLLHVGTVVLILLSNDSRTSSLFALVALVGATGFPRLTGRGAFLVMPLVIAAGFAIVHGFGVSQGDDLQGRISVTVTNLLTMEWGVWFGLGGSLLGSFMDSGYAYVISGATIFGLVALWLLLATAVPADTAPRRRCLYGLNIYMAANLMIGGTAVFSIKIAAPLWLLVGYMSARRPAATSALLPPIATGIALAEGG